MKSIACYIDTYEKDYVDKEGNTKHITYEPKDWQLGTYIDNGTKEGMKQRVHEEEMMLRGEVIGKENDYGVDWETYFKHRKNFYSEQNTDKNSIRSLFIKDITRALNNIGNLVEVRGIIFAPSINNKKTIHCGVFAIYNNILGEPDILQDELIS